MKRILYFGLVIVFLFSLTMTTSTQAAGTPYWAGYESKELSCNECESDWYIQIKYSKDGKKYKANFKLDDTSFGEHEGTCEGKVFANGVLERKVCVYTGSATRSLGGTVKKLELTGDGNAGDATWIDKRILAKKKASPKSTIFAKTKKKSLKPIISIKTKAGSRTPYWAGFESKQIPSNDGLSDFIITIKYSKDGKKYKITYLNHSPHVEGTCEGEIYKDGDLEEIECEKDSGGTRTISGTVTEITLESSGSAGGGIWKLGKKVFAGKKSSSKPKILEKAKKKSPKPKVSVKVKKKAGTSYLESSRHMHIYKKFPGWDLDPETMTYDDGTKRLHIGILKSYEDIGPENLKYVERIFPLRKGKKFTYNLSRGSSEWQYIAEVKEEYIKNDPELGDIYCFKIEGTFENKWTSWSSDRGATLCPVYGRSFKFLKTGPATTTYRKLLSHSKVKTAFRVESKSTKIILINLTEEKAEQLRLIEVKRKEELKRIEKLARKKKEAELARKKREAELARKKREAELARKKREAELARKKREAELARKKLLEKRKLEAEKKRRKLVAERKRKKELQMKLFPPLSSKATKLSNDIQLFLQKNAGTPYLIEIATLIGKVKQSQKKKEVLRLKKSLETLRKLLPKVKGFSAFEAKREKARAISKLKLLNEKIMSGKDLRSFLKSFIAKNMLNDLETVQKILPVLKKLIASLKSPKLEELNKLIPEIQKFILRNPSLRKAVANLKQKQELEAKRKQELEAKRKQELEAKRKQELEAKRKQELEAKRKQ
ncbi:MAG: hypothetical protein VX794_05845, partial [Nitrospinota bacterium]|nr:hypothetical protein [Nitrospinota bacterium]